eukprot:m.174462 g.174462  ORF g.174462 m.174462 type:complete len:575 (+) comp15322_c1_seq1:646-2370(+)
MARVAAPAPVPAATAATTDSQDPDADRARVIVAPGKRPGAARREGSRAVTGGEGRVGAACGGARPVATVAIVARRGENKAGQAWIAISARPGVHTPARVTVCKGQGGVAAPQHRQVSNHPHDLRSNHTQVALINLEVKLRVEGVGIRAGDQVRHSLLDERSGGVGIELGGQLGCKVVVSGLGGGHGVDHTAHARVNHGEIVDIHLLVEGVLERIGLAAVHKLRHHLGDLRVDGAEAGLVHLVGELLGKSVLGTIHGQQCGEDVLDDGDANRASQHCRQALLKDSGVVHVGGQAGCGGSALGAGLENLGGKGVLGCHDAVDQTLLGRGGARCLHQQRGREGRLGGGGAVVLNPNFDAQASLGRDSTLDFGGESAILLRADVGDVDAKRVLNDHGAGLLGAHALHGRAVDLVGHQASEGLGAGGLGGKALTGGAQIVAGGVEVGAHLVQRAAGLQKRRHKPIHHTLETVDGGSSAELCGGRAIKDVHAQIHVIHIGCCRGEGRTRHECERKEGEKSHRAGERSREMNPHTRWWFVLFVTIRAVDSLRLPQHEQFCAMAAKTLEGISRKHLWSSGKN